MRVRESLLLLPLSLAACDLRCSGGSQLGISVESSTITESKTIRGSTVIGEPKRTVEVEVERTVCDAIDLELERIVLLPPDPPFRAHPIERVSIRITNGAAVAVQLDSGTEATFLDERRTLVKADLFQSDWFMPLALPAKSAAVVQILVPEGAGKALRLVEVEASPVDDPFSDCKVADDLLGTPAPATAPAETKAEAEPAPR